MGDVTHIYSTDGALQATYLYDAWGNCKILDADGSEVTDTPQHLGYRNPIRYRGYYYDTETDLYYLMARYYDPETGRFLSQDDMSFLAPEHLTGLNLFAYCNNNPVMCVDPTGNSPWSDFWNNTAGKILGTVLVVSGMIALTVATAGIGTSIVAALGGGMLGAIAGGAVGGAISGAIFGAGLSIINQGITKGYSNINIKKVGIDTLVGIGAGAVSGALFSAVGRGMGFLGKTNWAQRELKNWSYDSKNFFFGSSKSFTFFRNGHKFRLETSLQHGVHYHRLGSSKVHGELIFKLSESVAGFLPSFIYQF